MQILQLLYGAVPTSALCKAGSYIYELVSCAICCAQLRFPVGESHAQSCTIHLLEPLLHNKAFIYKSRTTVQLIHKSADAFHNMVYRLLTYALYFGTQLRCVHQNRNYETLDIHRDPPAQSALHFVCFSACYTTRAAWNYAIYEIASTNSQCVPYSIT